ncbi:hypothetical protein SKC37_00815 [Aquirufa sp. HETE-83D]|uniref:Outer membrane protein beta-barrel domain-containing protein n=1 Tax=Aquirufa esocilacus TaxID=3096513 RepID=A0ABW6DES3_9BACT
MKVLLSILLLFSISFVGLCQEVDLRNEMAVERIIGEDNYFFRSMLPIRDGKSSIEEVKRKLEIELRSSLANKIISTVKVENKSKSVQLSINDTNDARNNSTKEEINFEFNSNIKSDLTFSDAKLVFQEDNRNNVLFGLIYVDKAKFLEQNFGKIKYEINKLVSEVSSITLKEGRPLQLKYNEFLKGKNDIYTLIEIQNVLEPGRVGDDADLINKVYTLGNKLTDMLAIVESGQFQKDLIDAKDKLHSKNFRGALADFEILAVKYPGNTTLANEREAALNAIADDYKDKVASNDYLYALESIKALESLDKSFVAKYFETKNILIKNAFESYLSKAEASVNSKDYKEAKYLINKIRDFRYFDSNRFDFIERRVDDNIFRDKVIEIDHKISNKSFVDAYQLILSVKKEYPLRNMNEVNNKEQFVVDALTELKVNEIKSQRPMTWQLQIGGGLISNFYSLPASDINNYKIATASSVGEIGLYRKTGIKKEEGLDGKPTYTANAVGIRLAVWYPNQVFVSAVPGASQFDAGLGFKSTVFEPQLSFYTLRMCNLNFGKIVGDIVDIKTNRPASLNDFYTFTLGIRPRIGNVMLNVNAKLISDMATKNYVTVQATLNLALNFSRKFKESERAEIRNSVQNVKNLY